MKSQPVPPQPMSPPTQKTTALSGAAVDEPRKFAHLPRMARASLFLVVVTAFGGLHCLITANPDFTKPVRTAPFLTKPVPSPFVIQRRNSIAGLHGVYASESLTFEVVSEDLQSGLQALLLLDFQGDGVPYTRVPLNVKADIKPGHLNGVPREAVTMTLEFGRDVQPGCHSVTAVVSHEFNLTLAPKDPRDVGTLTWWYELVDSDTTKPDAPSTCVVEGRPSADGGVSDAGADAMDARAQ